MQKHFISANELTCDSFRLAEKIYRSGFRPELIIGVWRGGAPVAIAVHEYLDFTGIQSEHFPIKASSYSGIDEQNEVVDIEGFDSLSKRIQHTENVLIVDDVFDSGRTLKTILGLIQKASNRDVRIAVPWYKPEKNVTDIVPNFYVHETEQWLVFPHELMGLSMEEIKAGKPDMADLLPDLSS